MGCGGGSGQRLCRARSPSGRQAWHCGGRSRSRSLLPLGSLRCLPVRQCGDVWVHDVAALSAGLPHCGSSRGHNEGAPGNNQEGRPLRLVPLYKLLVTNCFNLAPPGQSSELAGRDKAKSLWPGLSPSQETKEHPRPSRRIWKSPHCHHLPLPRPEAPPLPDSPPPSVSLLP